MESLSRRRARPVRFTRSALRRPISGPNSRPSLCLARFGLRGVGIAQSVATNWGWARRVEFAEIELCCYRGYEPRELPSCSIPRCCFLCLCYRKTCPGCQGSLPFLVFVPSISNLAGSIGLVATATSAGVQSTRNQPSRNQSLSGLHRGSTRKFIVKDKAKPQTVRTFR